MPDPVPDTGTTVTDYTLYGRPRPTKTRRYAWIAFGVYPDKADATRDRDLTREEHPDHEVRLIETTVTTRTVEVP